MYFLTEIEEQIQQVAKINLQKIRPREIEVGAEAMKEVEV